MNSKIRAWKTIDSRFALDHPWYRVKRDTVELPNGKVIDDYHYSMRPEVVLIFPVTTDGKVVMVEQYKHGAKQILYEFPGGIFDETTEPAVLAAARELVEETGCTGPEMKSLGTVWDDPAKQSNRLHLFLATEVATTAAQSLDETEFIQIHQFPLEEIPNLIGRGEICTAGALALAFRAFQTLNAPISPV